MERKKFIKTILTGAVTMTSLLAFNRFTNDLKEQEQVMPVLFIGHGSPMNGIEDNEFSRRWTQMAKEIPTANIPVLQLSIDYTKDPQYHYDLAKELYNLRKKGVLIIGSGNMVHNLRMVAWNKMNEPGYGFDWALKMNDTFKYLIKNGDHNALINYKSLGKEGSLAIPTPEHYLPLLYSMALKGNNDDISFFNDKAVAGSLTMTSVKIG